MICVVNILIIIGVVPSKKISFFILLFNLLPISIIFFPLVSFMDVLKFLNVYVLLNVFTISILVSTLSNP